MAVALAKKRNAADERFPARPAGARLSPQGRVAILAKGWPFAADRALPCGLRRALNVTGIGAGDTG